MQFNGPQSHILFVGNLWGPCSHVIYERSQNPALARGADLIFAAEISEQPAEAAAAGGGHSGG